MNRAWGSVGMVCLLAWAGRTTALPAADGLPLCQTGMVLMVPPGGPGVVADPFVTAPGAPVRAATRATVQWDDSALTVVFDCADTNVEARHTRRDDVEMWRDDCVEVFLDVGHMHDPRGSPWLHIIVSAAGGVFDSQGGDPWFARFGGDPSCQLMGLTARVERSTGGWRATVVMPWEGIGRTPRAGDTWGLNLNRENHPEEEYQGWAPTLNGFQSVHEWGHLVFAPPGHDGAAAADSNAWAAIARRHEEIPPLLWSAGLARVAITPPQPLWMAGYGGRDHAAEGKTSDLWAKVLVLEDHDGRRAALVTLDLLGIDRTLSTTLCARLERQFGLRRDQVVLSASHTHSGPVVGFNLRPTHFEQVTPEQKALITGYASHLEEQVVAAVGKALTALAPACLSWGNGQATFAVNRRMNREPDVARLRAAGQLQGPVDPDVPVLAVRAPDGSLRAVVFGYACHATVLNRFQWDGDYPGYAQTELEARYPGAVALFWAGCGADQNPLPRGTVELAQTYGRQLAGAVETVLAGPMRSLPAWLQTRYREVDLPFAFLPTAEQLRQEAASGDATTVARARVLLQEIDAGRPLCWTYPYPVAQWRLGRDVHWVFLGGEVVVDYALRLKAGQSGKRIWVAACANDVMGYIPSRRVLHEGGYEGSGATVTYGLPAPWSPAIEEIIVDESMADDPDSGEKRGGESR